MQVRKIRVAIAKLGDEVGVRWLGVVEVHICQESQKWAMKNDGYGAYQDMCPMD
jgi:hypothetical protein